MLTLKEIMAWLKTKDESLDGIIFNSTIDGNKAQCVGVYARKNGPLQPLTLGTESSLSIKSVTLLIHWSKNADVCERKALELWEILRKASTTEKIGTNPCWIVARNAPVSVGKDDLGIFECVLDFEVYARKG